MILLGFMAGWCAATYWWPWVLSFYEPKPLPPLEITPQSGANGTRAHYGWLSDVPPHLRNMDVGQ